MGEKKIIIAIVLITIAILGGAVWVLGSSAVPKKAVLEKVAGAKIEVAETNFNFKDIPYSGGNAIHEFKIKNIGDKDLIIANIKTSCTCTKAYLKSAQGEGPKFSLHSKSSNWTGKLAPSEEAVIVSDFDPTAHGPQGVGPINRIISFETNDPDHPYMEFTFEGTVVK